MGRTCQRHDSDSESECEHTDSDTPTQRERTHNTHAVCESVRAVEPLSRLAQRRMPKAKGAVTKVKGMIMIVGVGVRV